MDVDSHDKTKVINVDELRRQYVDNINMSAHLRMRRATDVEFWHANRHLEMAHIVALSQHNCIQTVCSGDDLGRGSTLTSQNEISTTPFQRLRR